MTAIGSRVKVITEGDEFCDRSRIGHIGTVVDACTDDNGATESDPLWIVEFGWTDGVSSRRVDWCSAFSDPEKQPARDGFWTEELEVIP
jgi:hypothetical protein